jgi:hypothetical protein
VEPGRHRRVLLGREKVGSSWNPARRVASPLLNRVLAATNQQQHLVPRRWLKANMGP